MNTKRNFNYSRLFPFLLCILTLFMGIGYAAINSITGEIKGSVTATAQEGIFITDVVYAGDQGADSVNSSIDSMYQTLLTSKVVLGDSSESFISYKVSIYNSTEYEYAFQGPNYDSDFYKNKNITFNLVGLDVGDKISGGGDLSFTITFSYLDKNNISNNELDSVIDFVFKRVYSVEYVNMDDSNYAKEAIEGNIFTVTFPYDTANYLKVTMNDQELVLGDNYTYDTSTKVLSLYNVVGDVVIEYTYTSPAIEMPGDYFVPIWYNGERWKISSKDRTNWYNYDNQEWANGAILIESKRGVKDAGDSLNVATNGAEAMAMFVWIPRFEYKINGIYGTHTDGTAGTATTPGEIEVNFIPVEQVTPSEGYTIHPAFTFGSTQLAGFWAGKFETSHSTLASSTDENNLECTNASCSNADGLVILPGLTPLGYNNVSNFFFAARSMSRSGNAFAINSSEFDSHMMKNSEWGAIAYLSQSKYGKYGNSIYTGVNKEVYQNKSTITGNSNGTPSQDNSIDTQCTYDVITDRGSGTGMCGAGASTTGNIYGIYDMSGSYNEYMVGYLTTASDTWGAASGGNSANFSSQPNAKYFDGYTSATSSQACNGSVCKGHALDEVAGWYGDSVNFINEGSPWLLRGGASDRGNITGPFYYSRTAGAMSKTRAFRVVLSAP